MNSAITLHGLFLLGEWIVMATAILVAARLITMLVRRNAALRHLIWLIAFFSLLLTPLFMAFIPAHFALHVPNVAPASSAPEPVVEGTPEAGISHSAEVRSPAAPRAISGRHITAALLGIWLGGIGIVGIMGFAAVLGIRRVRRNSVEHAFDAIDLPELSARIGVRRSWKLRVGSTQNPRAAMTWGFLHPIVVLPKESVGWTKDRLEAVLLHELAHMRRYDSLSQWLTFAVCALYWFHPVVWRFVARMRAEAELAADDAVLVSGVKPSAYASVLLRFAAELGQRNAPSAYAGVSFMRQSRIAARIGSILNTDQRERRVTPLQAMNATGLGFAAVLILAALRPSVSIASASPASPAMPVIHGFSGGTIADEPALSPEIQKTNATSAAQAKAPSTKRCHNRDVARKSVKTSPVG